MFTAALFTIARTWKQPRCPLVDEWIGKLWYKYTVEYYSAIKKNTRESVLMRWMKLEPIIQSKKKNRPPAQAGCMRRVLGAGAPGRPRGVGWRGRREGGSGWGTHVNPWLIHVSVWQKPLQCCKVISLQLIKINEKILKKRRKSERKTPIQYSNAYIWNLERW